MLARHQTKTAATLDAEGRRACEDVMAQIYLEEPTFWPHGLSIDGHDSVYMIREAAAGIPVGFTGWQQFRERGSKVGYYSIGVLPQHRGRGYARAAVSELLAEKRASVDRVRAFIVPHNLPSIHLARVLGVEVTHNG